MPHPQTAAEEAEEKAVPEDGACVPGQPGGKTTKGRLFSRGFLDQELKHTQPWQALDTRQLASIKVALESIVSGASAGGTANTKHRVIWPVLRCLGWREEQRGQPPRPERVPAGQQQDQGLVVLKTTAWQANLDQGHGHQPAPAACMVGDLRRMGRPRWGILTNGDRWRLYDGQARSIAQGFLEIPLLQALKHPHLLRRFVVFFRPQALGCNQDGHCWLKTALTAHQRRQKRIATAFTQQVCHQVFPILARAVAQAAPTAAAAAVREASLVLLYRLLFLLYGESRGLLNSRASDDGNSLYGLAHRVAEARRRGQRGGEEQHSYWATIAPLLQNMGHGQPGLDPSGGPIFSAEQVPLLDNVICNDETVANALMGLCFIGQDEPIDYGDLAVEQLGALYEQLMAYRLKRDAGHLTMETNRLFRKTASCYYTPGKLVDLILQETIAPLAQGCSPQQLLNLKICDSAMGTGNFLIGLLDHLSDAVLAATTLHHPPSVQHRHHDLSWLRNTHLRSGDDETVRNLVLQHCIYGVDKDPMAVDLARMGLMLHGDSMDAGHLHHHLHCGNSLFGCWVRDAVTTIRDTDGSTTLEQLLQASRSAAAPITRIDTTSLPSHANARHWSALDKANASLKTIFSVIHARHWLRPTQAGDRDIVHDLWRGRWGNPIPLVTGVVPVTDQRLAQILDRMRVIMAEEGFFHWQLACPGLWPERGGLHQDGGFDAVIGNPPWDRVQLQQVEWFAQNCPDVARAPHAAARRQRVAQLQRIQAPQAVAYARAAARAAAQSHGARSCGDYPLLSGGDVNLYGLFVERAMALVKSRGLVAMLTPSSLASGKTGSAFFRRVTQEGRLKVLYDFENRKTFFPDVHGSFRFCVFVAWKTPQKSSHHTLAGAAHCAFRLSTIAQLNDPERRFFLRAEDFARVNPNTGTAPLFRTRRDARIATGIYGRLPVLVNRSGGRISATWPVTYKRMFDMSINSHLFCSKEELQGQKGKVINMADPGKIPEDGQWLPFYEGKMMQAFDHRAADIVVNQANMFRPAQQRLLQDSEKVNPDRRPRWRYYVHGDAKHWFWPDEWVIAFKDITSATNMRTMIAGILPRAAVSHKLPLLLLNDNITRRSSWACFILANLNSIVFDFVVRQKLYGTSLTLHILEQLPVVPPGHFDMGIGSTTVASIIVAAVLELTYTAWDLTAFARSLGHRGPPFVWNPQRRLHLRARLDALFFLLYGITNEEEIHYIYSTFPILRRRELDLYGRYRSAEACLKALRMFQRCGAGTMVLRDP